MNWKARPSAGPYVLLARTRDDREERAELREQMTALVHRIVNRAARTTLSPWCAAVRPSTSTTRWRMPSRTPKTPRTPRTPQGGPLA